MDKERKETIAAIALFTLLCIAVFGGILYTFDRIDAARAAKRENECIELRQRALDKLDNERELIIANLFSEWRYLGDTDTAVAGGYGFKIIVAHGSPYGTLAYKDEWLPYEEALALIGEDFPDEEYFLILGCHPEARPRCVEMEGKTFYSGCSETDFEGSCYIDNYSNEGCVTVTFE